MPTGLIPSIFWTWGMITICGHWMDSRQPSHPGSSFWRDGAGGLVAEALGCHNSDSEAWTPRPAGQIQTGVMTTEWIQQCVCNSCQQFLDSFPWKADKKAGIFKQQNSKDGKWGRG